MCRVSADGETNYGTDPPCIIYSDPCVVSDFESTGLRLSRFGTDDQEQLYTLMIQTVDQKERDAAFKRDVEASALDRPVGVILAELARHRMVRAIASRDGQRLILQEQDPAH